MLFQSLLKPRYFKVYGMLVLGQDVVDPLPRLLDARLSGGLEEIDEEILHVVVGDVFCGRHDIELVTGFPVELVHACESPCMLCRVQDSRSAWTAAIMAGF